MTQRTRQIASLLLAVALIALLLLSVSLPGMRLQPGSPFPGGSNGAQATPGKAVAPQTAPAALPALGMVLAILLVIVIIFLSVRFFGQVSMRRFLEILLALILLIVLLNILPHVIPGPPALLASESAAPATAGPGQFPVAPLGEPPSAFLWIAGGCVFLGIGLLAVRLLRQRSKGGSAADAVAQVAEEALIELSAGKDFSSVIIRCYLQMNEVLRAERDIERPYNLTAREFRDSLRLQGVPEEPVNRLTLLFEKARYSAEPMSLLDENTGKECLSQIVAYCRARDREAEWTAS